MSFIEAHAFCIIILSKESGVNIMQPSRFENAFINKKSSTLLALLVMFFWGSLFPMIKIGYQAFGVNTSSVPSILLFAGMRFVLCGGAFMVVIALRGRKIGKSNGLSLPDKSALVSILAIALTAYVLHYTCTYVGISHLESSKTAIIKQIGTLFIICFAFLFRKEDRFTVAKMIGGILGFASILVVNLNNLKFSISIWDILIMCASFCSVASMVFSKNAYDHHDPIFITAWAQLIGGIVLLIIGLTAGGSFGKFDIMSVLVIIYMCFASSMGYGLWNMLMKHNDMSRLNTIKFTETLFSAVCSWVILGENIFRWEYLVSFLLVCLGIMIGNGTLKKLIVKH